MAPSQTALDQARTAIERTGRLPPGMVPPHIAASWQRCLSTGLNPRERPEALRHSSAELRLRRERAGRARSLALAEMQLLYNQIAGTNFMIALGDPEGVVLDTITDPAFGTSDSGREIVPGSAWSERSHGTNALGLAAVTRDPVTVHGGEHFFLCHRHVSCMASPILNSSGELVGLLDASSNCETRQYHTLALVQMAAAHIENGLIFAEQSDALVLLFHPRVEFLNTLSAGVLALSGDGTVRSINRRGSRLLAGLGAERGSRFDALFRSRFDEVLPRLLSGNVLRIRDHAGSAVFVVCRQTGEAAGGRPVGAARPHIVVAPPAPDSIEFVAEDSRVTSQLRVLSGAVSARMPIHVTGETGTGKELIARHVHAVSGRKGRFVAVNCGALPESLFIAELFGYGRGAFTDARREGSKGLIQDADGGTLFLDEVGEIPLPAQAALLRFLDDYEVRPIGEAKAHRVDVQIVSATNRDLDALAGGGGFRRDLLYRLNAVTVALPTLRSRSDFQRAVQFTLGRIAPGLAITDSAIAVLAGHDWPGNFRELRSVLQRIALGAGEGPIDETMVAAVLSPAEAACPHCRGSELRRSRCQQILRTFEETGRNVSEAARILGISRTTLYRHVEGFLRPDQDRK
ncbi:MAG: sigma-54-dependent Fis family transcriptional regulator [Pseudomonadota bacterium]